MVFCVTSLGGLHLESLTYLESLIVFRCLTFFRSRERELFLLKLSFSCEYVLKINNKGKITRHTIGKQNIQAKEGLYQPRSQVFVYPSYSELIRI